MTISTIRSKTMSTRMNRRCRSAFYTRSNIERFQVPDDLVPWEVKWPRYSPPDFTAPHILISQHGSDPDLSDQTFKPLWHFIHQGVDRKSSCGRYPVVDGRPRNPFGRTGLGGRGLLRRWGPNHETDTFVTRWKMKNGQIVVDESSKKPILQFLAEKCPRYDQWEIPKSTVESSEFMNQQLKRAFLGTNTYLGFPDNEWKTKVESFFDYGVSLFRGYVDDPRNTDNAWVETTSILHHGGKGKVTTAFSETDIPIACDYRWMDVNSSLKCEAVHSRRCLKKAAKFLNAHWSST